MEYPYDKPASAESPAKDGAMVELGEGRMPPFLSPLLIAAFAFGVVDLLFMPIASAVGRKGPGDAAIYFMMIVAGPLIAQFGILPAWLVWGESRFWQRLLIHWALAATLALAWLAGLLLVIPEIGPTPENLSRDLAAMTLCLPAVSLAIEVPLWITRHILGWRLGRSNVLQKPLAIRDFLYGMAIVSVALALVRAAGAVVNPRDGAEVWTGVAIVGVVGSIASLAVILPLAWFLLRFARTGHAIIVTFVYSVLAGLALLAILIGISGLPPTPQPVIGLGLLCASVAASIAAAFGLARGMGYRLIVGKST